jgi:hypothetical protein
LDIVSQVALPTSMFLIHLSSRLITLIFVSHRFFGKHYPIFGSCPGLVSGYWLEAYGSGVASSQGIRSEPSIWVDQNSTRMFKIYPDDFISVDICYRRMELPSHQFSDHYSRTPTNGTSKMLKSRKRTSKMLCSLFSGVSDRSYFIVVLTSAQRS